MNKIVLSVALLPLLLLGCNEEGSDEAQLRILATTDLHMYLNDFDYYRDMDDPNVGLVRTTTLIKEARGEVSNSILVDAGDLIQGSPMGDEAVHGEQDQKRPHAAFHAMNELGYDAAAAGNHEFNFGLDFLNGAVEDAQFPYLSANVYWDDGDDDDSNDKTLLPPYAILDRELTTEGGEIHTIKIGVIGLLPPQIMNWDGDKLRGKVKTRDIRLSAEKYIPEIEAQGADIIIAVAHTGLSAAPYRRGAEQSGTYLAALPGIDAVVTGHSHALFPSDDYARLPNANVDKGTIHGKPVVMAGYFGSHLGVIDLSLRYENNGWTVVDGQSSLRAIKKDGEEPIHVHSDENMEELVKPYHDRTRDYMAQPVGATTERLSTYVAHLRDEPALEIIAEAQRAYVKNALKETEYKDLPILSAVAPFKAGGRPGPDFYTDIPAGPLTLRHVADLYVYPNVISAVKMNGGQIREWLEMSTRIFNQIKPDIRAPQPLVNDFIPSYNFDVLDGVTFKIDLTQPSRYGRGGQWERPEAQRIRDLRFNDRSVSEQDEFIVATNNYRANGGGSFPGLDGSNVVLTSTDTVQQALSAYLIEAGEITPTTNNSWSFEPMEGAPQVIYKVGPKGEDQVAAIPGARKLEEDEEGFSTFILDFNALSELN